MSPSRITVIGIGQTLRGDDAAGIEAVRLWVRAFAETASRPEMLIQYSELPGLGLLDLLEGFDAAVIVDAIQVYGSPGRVHRLGQKELAAFTAGSGSAHGWGVAETLALDWQLHPARRSIPIRLVGIEAAQMELGKGLSDAVRQSLPLACEAIEAEVHLLLG